MFVGTLYPLALEALTGDKISVGAPFFNLTFGPLFVPLLIAVPFGPLLAWKRGDVFGAAQRLIWAAALGIAALAVTFAIQRGAPVLAPFGVGLAVYVMIGALIDPIERIGLFRQPYAVAFARARGLPRSAWGTAVAHFAAGMLLFGVIAESQWNSERIVSLKPGGSVSVSGYDLTLDQMVPRKGPNYSELIARFTVRRDGEVVDVLEPSKRTFPQRQMSTTEAALLTRGASQLYLSLGDVAADGAIAIRLYHKPLVLLIWFGCVVMVLGGALSLSDRRLRVGAPKPARKSALQPAE